MQTFTEKPDYGAQASFEPKVQKIEFGDGFEQTRAQGINHNLKRYSLTFSGTQARITQIADFLFEHGAFKAFYWTPFDGKQGRYKCDSWQITQNNGFFTLTAEFREVVL
jgi:phage-related protein